MSFKILNFSYFDILRKFSYWKNFMFAQRPRLLLPHTSLKPTPPLPPPRRLGVGRGGVGLREVCKQLFYICLRCMHLLALPALPALPALHACFRYTDLYLYFDSMQYLKTSEEGNEIDLSVLQKYPRERGKHHNSATFSHISANWEKSISCQNSAYESRKLPYFRIFFPYFRTFDINFFPRFCE
jgi:hypothetical protein